MRRLLGGDDGDGVAILGAQPAQHVQDLAHLPHWLADIAERIGELLEASGVLGDVHIALDHVPKLYLQIDSAMELIVTELIVDSDPDAVRGRLRMAYDVAHILGDGVVQPTQDALINHTPIGIMALVGGWRR